MPRKNIIGILKSVEMNKKAFKGYKNPSEALVLETSQTCCQIWSGSPAYSAAKPTSLTG
jgi:hypothetical protein